MSKILEIEKVEKALTAVLKDYIQNNDLTLVQSLSREIMYILPDKPEPITEKDFLDLLYQTTNTPRILGEEGHAMAIFRPLLKAINEHFLGGK